MEEVYSFAILREEGEGMVSKGAKAEVDKCVSLGAKKGVQDMLEWRKALVHRVHRRGTTMFPEVGQEARQQTSPSAVI